MVAEAEAAASTDTELAKAKGPVKKPCQKCRGTGQTLEGVKSVKCAACNGSGAVTK